MSTGKKVFIVGPGFIGSNVLDLLVAEGYSVRALVRRQEAGKDIKAWGAEPVIGELDDTKLISEEASQSDIVIHAATADHLPSAQGVLDGVKTRASKGLSTIYIHTSGASVFDDGAEGAYKNDKVYRDDKPEEIDTVADTAPHREIDLAILKVKKELQDKAKIVIMVPPLIYGYIPKHDRLSIQIPKLTRFAIEHGYAGHMGEGLSVISTIHVLDLARAYIYVLHHLENTSASDSDLINPYYFIESSHDKEPSWREVAEAIGEGLHKSGHLDDPKPHTLAKDQYGDLFAFSPGPVFGLNTRTRSVRLPKLGWKPQEIDWRSSFLDAELPQILKES
ncbi:hypothetical protein AMS68_003551 [Peltaster fructicola]|uniref:NAD-dependent epimerase/dehydratase domain-containing protein n=1 Tax=Peltaster fructicola TaxID=286661 RepID=A0A6H0XTH1_9PEZI|nr:hypothetical protein AMS68_003551 [Peltaster fructicola]